MASHLYLQFYGLATLLINIKITAGASFELDHPIPYQQQQTVT